MKANSEYHGGDCIFVYAGEVISDSIRLHELAHQYLNKSTHWGMMLYMQAQLRRADKLYERVQYHIEIGNLLMQAAENTFESHATMLQLLYAKENDVNEFYRLLNSPYYTMYNKEYFDIFLNMELPTMEIVNMCQQIPMLALATDLIDVESKYWKTNEALFEMIKSNPDLYNPDVRFKHLVKVYISIIKERGILYVKDTELVRESKLFVKTREYDETLQIIDSFSEIINDVFPNDSCINDAFELIRSTSITEEITEIIHDADSLDIPLPLQEYETVMIDKLEKWLNECSVLIIIPYEELAVLQYHITQFSKRFVCTCEWCALPILYVKFKNSVVLYEEDYDYMKKKFPYLHSRRIFYYYEGSYKYFTKNINDKNFVCPPVFLYKINEKTYCIFIKGNQNEIFFTAQNQGGVNLFMNDLLNGKFQYINLGDSKTDSYFFISDIDWSVYEDVVKSVLHVKYTCGRCDIF